MSGKLFSRLSDCFAGGDGGYARRDRGGAREAIADDARHEAFVALKQALLDKRGCSPDEVRVIAGILDRAAADIRGMAVSHGAVRPGAAEASAVPAAVPAAAEGVAPVRAPGAPDGASSGARHQTMRVGLEARRRELTVSAVGHLTPGMLRVEFASPELATFDSRSPDDHVKLFLPGGVMRDYTPRAFDRERCTLTIDFALHDAGPATRWALQAKAGDRLQIGGPRGSRVTPDDFDWYLLVGDETALPAIGRRLEELRSGVPVITVVVVDGMAEAQQIPTKTDWTPHWVCRDRASGSDADLLLRTLQGIDTPPGEGYVWIAGEARISRTLRDDFINRRKHPRQWLKAAGYWVQGAPGSSEKHDD